jgi:hypothetical protein
MMRGIGAALLLACLLGPQALAGPATTVETIVLVRHGEKPAAGLGQLDCQGLNRSLALPAVIQRDFGRPAAIFAPNPADRKSDLGIPYDYIRPLATIEPTAIAFGMPVDTSFGVDDWQILGRLLLTPRYAQSLVLIAWEHSNIVKLARFLAPDDAKAIPAWDRSDFDSIYVIRIERHGAASSITFVHRFEGLNGQSPMCPGFAPR